MRVLFLQDVANVARAGDIKEVANGYAKNHLFPRKLVTLATSEELKRISKFSIPHSKLVVFVNLENFRNVSKNEKHKGFFCSNGRSSIWNVFFNQ